MIIGIKNSVEKKTIEVYTDYQGTNTINLDVKGKLIMKEVKRTRGFEVVAKDYLKAYSVCEEVTLPLRGTAKSAGYDFFLPTDVEILPGEGAFIWTDVKAYMLDDEVLEIYPRSSLANKNEIRIKNIVGIIDSDYYSNVKNDGNIGIFLWNFGDRTRVFNKGDAVVQGIFKKFLESDNCNSDVTRVGGSGSTDK